MPYNFWIMRFLWKLSELKMKFKKINSYFWAKFSLTKTFKVCWLNYLVHFHLEFTKLSQKPFSQQCIQVLKKILNIFWKFKINQKKDQRPAFYNTVFICLKIALRFLGCAQLLWKVESNLHLIIMKINNNSFFNTFIGVPQLLCWNFWK